MARNGLQNGDTLNRGALRSHLALEEDDPALGEKFSTVTLQQGAGHGAIPSRVHGAPSTAAESREVLARLKRMAGFESQDFDPAENDVEREYQIHRTEEDYALAEFWKWALAFLIGVAMGCIGFIVDWGIQTLNDFKYYHTVALIASRGGFLAPFFMYVGISLLYASVAGALVSFVEPLAAGSGIAEVKTYLNGIHIRGLLAVRTLVAKLIGVVFSIAAGLIAGKEGPFVHGGGIVGGGIGSMGSQTLTAMLGGRFRAEMPRRFGGFFRNDADHRDFTAIGTAAGVATAFAAPIGGLLFTVEEGVSFYSTSIFWRGFLSTGIGVFTLHFLVECAQHPQNILSAHFGRYRDFGLYTDSLALYGKRMFYYVWDVPIFCLMGAVGGLMGALWVHVNVRVTAFRHRTIPVRSPWKRLLEVMLLVLLTAALWFSVAYSSPCKPLPIQEDLNLFEASEDADEEFYAGGGQYRRHGLEHFPQLWCQNGSYSVYGQVFFTPLSQALRLIIHLGEPLPEAKLEEFSFSYGALALFFVLPYALMMWTNGVGASTGMFVPALAVGATGGRLAGQIVRAIVHWAGVSLPVSLTSYSVIGAAAFMGGATRMTLTTTVMVMETTGALQLIVPLMITVFVAKVVGDQFGMGIDDTHMKIRGAPVLDEPALSPHQKMIADKLAVSELMSMAVVALPPIVKVRQVVETLRCCSHQAFPVTPDVKKAFDSAEPFELHGTILRHTVLHLLRHRIGFFDPLQADIPPSRSHIPSTQMARLRLLEKLDQRPLKLRTKDDQEPIVRGLGPAQLEQMLDLRPFMQRNPFVVAADASLSRAYRLFRTMGLRHLFVAPPAPKVMGVITRKDIAEANAKLALGRKATLGLTTPSERLVRHGSLPFIPYGAYDPTVGYSSSRMQTLSEDGSVEGSTPLAVPMAERSPGDKTDSRRRGRARGPPGAAEPESPGTARSEQSEMARLFKGPPS
ncbi:hypothetical protein CVIRNUC_003789 [Coccomyxa viridis]|uniref:Chloride channel protein n=1 Tax=Coccomyxa viridis TaxID=1274662 RepID=A0AAV1HZL2_9CHLO|nr:hypothetical protein CVIRNUC_003789 [Coccomyxa viridis]